MASTNKLPNTFLNQWLETDKPEMEDFNRDNRIVDGLAGHLQNIPKIGPDGNWYVWNVKAGEYADTGKDSQGDIGPRGPQGERGETGMQGLTGDQGPQGEKGETGATGPIGPQGEKGDKGDTGEGLHLLGLYGTVAELTAAHPSGMLGEAYAVGTAAENEVYVWSGDTWTNIGRLQGPQGVKGDAGEKGDTGTQGERGEIGPQGEQGPKGNTGDKGDTGEKGDKGDPGETGPQGVPAKVNGILPDESGEITLTAVNVGARSVEWMPTAAETGAAVTASYTATLTAAGWSAAAPYTQTAVVAGMTETMRPVADVVLSEAAETGTAQLEAWGCVSYIKTGNGTITAVCFETKPTADLSIQMKEVE